MIFRRISYRIALQFTAFVFVLLLVNGAVFLAADLSNARRQTHVRLQQRASRILIEQSTNGERALQALPRPLRERVRIVDASGTSIISGMMFDDIPFSLEKGFSQFNFENDEFIVLTVPILEGAVVKGYVQVGDIERLQFGDLPMRALIYLIVSVIISALTFVVGLFFARSSLKPAEEMMERLEQFTQDASHELRTPIAALSSSLDLALKNKKYHEGILSAKDDLKDVAVLVERLLELTRLDQFTLERTSLDLSGLVESSVEKHKPLAGEKNVTISAHLAPDISVQGDALLLKQVIGNLISNAIKFSKSDGGTITVRLTKDALSIEDTGVGIRKQDIPHIFDRFFQAENSRSNGGLGLGLALVKRIVELHGWRITAKSQEGKGTTFTVSFDD
ncbi:MAG: HAMP domain-containing histidine kinase [Candidatus Peribacteraceae bacterium]|nr:HAMP domain-containing histidine kinase [Candidatus Peribacteraceae bacterium]